MSSVIKGLARRNVRAPFSVGNHDKGGGRIKPERAPLYSPFPRGLVSPSAPRSFLSSRRRKPPPEPWPAVPKRHLKRLNAPRHWMLDKLGVWGAATVDLPAQAARVPAADHPAAQPPEVRAQHEGGQVHPDAAPHKVDGKLPHRQDLPHWLSWVRRRPRRHLCCAEKALFFSAAARLDACWSVRLWRRRSMRAPWPRGGVIRAALAGLSALSHLYFYSASLCSPPPPLLPLFFADVVSIEKSSENFRLLYDVRGRFAIHRIGAEEAKVSIPPPQQQQQPPQQQQRLARKPPRSSHIIAHTRHFLLTRHLSLSLSSRFRSTSFAE